MALRHELREYNGTPCVHLHGPRGASALVALHGAQVLSWIPADGRERLFLSERARFAEGSAIRGGVPVIFPQFAARGPLPKHGFARTLPWRFAGVEQDAIFELRDGDATAIWPHRFRARVRAALEAESLAITLEVENTGNDGFEFTAALHTYLAIDDDIGETTLHGLEQCTFEDSARAGASGRESVPLQFDGEVDRIYRAPPGPLELRDGPRRIALSQQGFADTVVWNPGRDLAATIGDLAPDDYQRFVCVEAGQVLQPVHLAPAQRWSGRQSIS